MGCVTLWLFLTQLFQSPLPSLRHVCSKFLSRADKCAQEFVSYYGKNTTAPELASKILRAIDDFKKE